MSSKNVSLVLSAEDEKLLQTLYTCDYDGHKMQLPSAVAGTCEWLQQQQKYTQWKTESGPRLLWMTSDAGCGKSVLVSYLIDQLHNERDVGSAVCYFFFSDTDGERNDSSSMMRCMLHQIFTAQPHLFKHATVELRSKGPRVTEKFSTMWKIFLATIRDPECRQIYCVVDALDECEYHSRHQIIKALCELFSNEPSGGEGARLRMFVTTRPLEYLTSGPYGSQSAILSVEEVMESINNDISLVVRARIDSLTQRRRLSKDVQIRLVQQLCKGADQTFLWATLVLGMLEDSANASEEAFNAIIKDLPRDLNGVYEKLLSQTSDVEMARKVLHIIVASFRPVTLKEINIALAIRSDDSTIADVKARLDPSIDYAIRKICGPIIRVSGTKITLVHSTAKSFLVRGPLHPGSPDNSWKHSLFPVDSHTLLADICTNYLLLEEIMNDCILDTISPKDVEGDIIPTEDPYDEERIKQIVDNYVNRYEFLHYSCKYWTEHYRRSKRSSLLSFRAEILCQPYGLSSYYTWFYVYTNFSPMWEHRYIELSKLMVASYFGLEDFAAKQINLGAWIDERDEDHWTALIYAAWSGCEAIVKMLLEKDAEVNARGQQHTAVLREDCTALMAAAANGHAEIVQLLIDHGAETKFDDELALSTAAAKGHEKVVATLLANGCDIEERNYYGQVPLHHACLNGRGEVFKLLVSHGASIFAKDVNGRSALDMAAESGSAEIVKWLLARGADVNGTDYYGTTAFDLAYHSEHDQILHILIAHGAQDPFAGIVGDHQMQPNVDHRIQPNRDTPTYNYRLISLDRLLKYRKNGMDVLVCFPWFLRHALPPPDGKGEFDVEEDRFKNHLKEMFKKIYAQRVRRAEWMRNWRT